MTDRPIIFSAPMVLALLAGRKSQTRRVLKKQPAKRDTIPADAAWAPDNGFKKDRKAGHTWALHSPYMGGSRLLHAAAKVLYAPGDRLWVREAWALPSNWTGPASRIAASCQEAGYKRPWAPIHYPADGTRDNWGHWRECEPGKPRSPIHMPRWASRLTLTVTEVRVQRLQEISPADAIAEGIPPAANSATIDCDTPNPRDEFRSLWNSLHGADAWEKNPEVVALTFTVDQRNIDA